ncbi:MAG: hypothetical protein IPH21_02365 [Flavobacteriales bacterium]|nr:hypothetical protein [Flavobacteriales bacterium]
MRENAKSTQANFKQIFADGGSEVLLRSTMNIEERKGFIDRNNPFGKDYYDPDGIHYRTTTTQRSVIHCVRTTRCIWEVLTGSYTRYRFRYRQNVSFGITAEKDEGEEFFKGSQKQGFDYYSAHLFLRDIGRLKAVAIGDYQAQFGQGLTFWNGLAFSSKSSFTMNIKRNAVGLSPYTSVNENLYLRGGAANDEVVKNVEVTGFFSRKLIDGNVFGTPTQNDTLGSQIQDAIFSSFQEDGFHRTNNELQKRKSIKEQIIGGHARYARRNFSIGATVSNVQYDAFLQPSTQTYSQFNFRGKTNSTAGLDWNYLYRNLTWFGEVSTSSNGGKAMNTGVLISLDKRVPEPDVPKLWQGLSRSVQCGVLRRWKSME